MKNWPKKKLDTSTSVGDVWERVRRVSVPGMPSTKDLERGYFTVRVTTLGWTAWSPVENHETS